MRAVLKTTVGAFLLLGGSLFCPSPIGTTLLLAQEADSAQVPQIKYFSLQHLAAEQMNEADRALLRARRKELIAEAQFYGYDITAGNWDYDQAVCPAFPDTLLLHYLQKFPDGSESLFTAVIPHGAGRVRIVPVLYRNASPYIPAVKNPQNFTLFNALVPPAIAKQDSGPQGHWLSLGVCYAELVGGRPNVPDEPSLDVATIRAPLATYRFDAATTQRQIQFSDRDAAKVFTIWTISLNGNGRVTGAINEDYATYVAHIVQPVLPPGTTTPAPPPSVVMPSAPEPPAKISPAPVPQAP